MSVQVYSGQVLVEERTFTVEKLALDFASFWQDNGYKVRISGL